MKEGVLYRINTASVAQIAAHLRQCDSQFVPPLSTRVDIAQYSQKLAALAVRFEAWSDKALIGLVASYDNDDARRCAFITSVSTLNDWQRRGVATTLLNACIERAAQRHAEAILLEVNADQTTALALYERMGFRRDRIQDTNLTLRMDLKGEFK